MKITASLFLLPLAAYAQDLGPPTKYGVLVFRAFQALDVFGPLDVLNTLSFTYKNLTLSVLSRTLDPVTTTPLTMNTTFGESIVPTHTLSNPPSDLEVLIVPGGVGTRAPDMNPEIDFIRSTFPSLRYLISVCTGNALVARAGLLDALKATGNKKSWAYVTQQSNKTHWVAKARWVVSSEKIWSTSGVSAGVDGTLDFVTAVYGEDVAKNVADGIEWTRVTDSTQDEFSELYGNEDVLPVAAPAFKT